MFLKCTTFLVVFKLSWNSRNNRINGSNILWLLRQSSHFLMVITASALLWCWETASPLRPIITLAMLAPFRSKNSWEMQPRPPGTGPFALGAPQMRLCRVTSVCLCDPTLPSPRNEEHFPDQRHAVRQCVDENGTQPLRHGPRAGGEAALHRTGPCSPALSALRRGLTASSIIWHIKHIAESCSFLWIPQIWYLGLCDVTNGLIAIDVLKVQLAETANANVPTFFFA